MSVNVQAIRVTSAAPAERRGAERTRDAAEVEPFASALRDAVRPRVPEEDESAPGGGRRLPGSNAPVAAPDVNHATNGNEVRRRIDRQSS